MFMICSSAVAGTPATAKGLAEASRGDAMTTILTEEVKCPNCETEFEIDTVASTNQVAMTTDFHPIARGFDPYYHFVHTCQNCGFSGYSEDFEADTIGPAVSEKISRVIRPRLQGDATSPHMSWEFTALIAEWQNQEPTDIADLYRHAAWCAGEEKEQQAYYRRTAARWLERALEGGDPDRPATLYLIGELYRRCGEKTLAERWFDEAIEAAAAADNDEIRKLAIQQKTDPQDIFFRASFGPPADPSPAQP
jgi:uncharacterized protein